MKVFRQAGTPSARSDAEHNTAAIDTRFRLSLKTGRTFALRNLFGWWFARYARGATSREKFIAGFTAICSPLLRAVLLQSENAKLRDKIRANLQIMYPLVHYCHFVKSHIKIIKTHCFNTNFIKSYIKIIKALNFHIVLIQIFFSYWIAS